MIGRTISHYRILEKLGAGGMGEVYLAHDEQLDRRVALKFLPEGLRADPAARRRFLREARAASKLSHPGIVGCLAIEEAGDEVFIAMEYVPGRSLRRVIEEGELTVDRAISIAVEVARAIAAAHAAGIVHRDLKPENIVITEDGHAKVLDFGVARVEGATHLTETAAAVGTAAYMSPEQARGEPVDARSDLFSLGAVLYEMITRHPPFRGDSTQAMIYSILTADPEPLARFKTGVNDELERIARKALRKDRDQRYQTAADFAADLLSDLTPTLPVTSRRAPRRSGRTWMAVAALLVLAAGAGAWLVLRGRGPHPEPRTGPALAVLQFRNLGAPGEDDPLAAGLTDEVITTLAGIQGLRVASRTAVDRYAGKTVDPRQVGRDLDVGYVLEGSIQHSGDELRVTAQLIKSADGFNVWARRFDGSMKDIFAVQDSLATLIADALSPVVGIRPPKVPRRWTENPEAYADFLRGREIYFPMSSWGDDPQSAAEALRWFQKAIALDPNYAPALVGVSDVLSWRWDRGHRVPGSLEEAIRLAKKAEKIDPTLGIALRSEARACFVRREFREARKVLERAVTVDPTLGKAYYTLSQVELALGNAQRSLDVALRGMRSDPDELALYPSAAHALADLGRYGDAREMLARGLTRFPDERSLLVAQATIAGQLNQHDEERRSLLKLISVDPTWSQFRRLGDCFESLHSPARSDSVYDLILDRWPDFPGALNTVGWHELTRGRNARAESLFTRAIHADSNFYFARLNHAKALGAENRKAEAERELLDLARRWPNETTVCTDIAIAFRVNLRDARTAETWARKAIRLNPEDEPARQQLGWALRDQSRYAESADAFQAAIDRCPDAYWDYQGLAIARTREGRVKDALAPAQRALEINPHYLQGLSTLAYIQMSLGDRHQAAVAYERQLAMDSLLSNALNGLANVYVEEGLTRKARTIYQRAVRADSLNWVPWFNLSETSLDDGDPVSAEEAARGILRVAGRKVYAEVSGDYMIGRARWLRGERDSAAAIFRMGLARIEPEFRFRPDDPDMVSLVGHLCAGVGDAPRARDLAERLFEQQKESARASYDAACIMALAGDRHRALDYLASAVAAGYSAGRQIERDNELATLRDEPRFQRIVASLQ